MTEPLDVFGFPMRLWIHREDQPNVVAAKLAEFEKLRRNPRLLAALRREEATSAPATPQMELFA